MTFLLENALITQINFSFWFYKVISFFKKKTTLHTDDFLWSLSIIISILRISPCASQSALEAVNLRALADFMHWPHSAYTDMHSDQDVTRCAKPLCLMPCHTLSFFSGTHKQATQ